MDMWILLAFLGGGMAAGFFTADSSKLLKISGYILHIGLLILIGIMGARIGADEEVISDIMRIGMQSFLLAVGGIIGSLIFLQLFSYYLRAAQTVRTEDESRHEDLVSQSNGSLLGLTAIILLTVVIGLVIGLVLPEGFLPWLENMTQYALAVLLLGVGIDLGSRHGVLAQLKTLGLRIVMIPLFIAAGSIIGTIITGNLLGFAAGEAGAVGAGFGWYSLSAVILTEIYSVELGSLAFLTNIMREMMAIVSIPLIASVLGPITAIAPCGATSMDVTLPLLKRSGGEAIVIPAFINGMILSALVPILVPFFISL